MTATYRLDLPYERPPAPLNGNTRAHWRARSAATRQVRSDVANLARAAGIPKAEHLTVELLWSPGDRRRRDADNLWPLLKVVCDALARGRKDWVGLELVPDDTPAYMDKRAPVILSPDQCGQRGMWLDITARQAGLNGSEPAGGSLVVPGAPLGALRRHQRAGRGIPAPPEAATDAQMAEIGASTPPDGPDTAHQPTTHGDTDG